MKKISLCIICELRKDYKELLECVASVEKYVDEVCITLTGSEGKLKKIPEELKKYKVSYFKWIEDFGKAREFNFKQATGDYILWLDSDDILKGAENLRSLVEEAEKNCVDGYWFNYWYQIDRFGEPVEIHPKMQFVKNDGHCKWSAPIHENLVPLRNSVKWVKTDKCIRVHKHGLSDSSEKTLRNLKIMERELIKQGENPDPRLLIYAAKALMMLARLGEAEPLLLAFLKKSGWKEEVYEAYMLLGEIYRRRKDYEHAHIAYLKAVELIPAYPDAYYGKGITYLGQERWGECIDWIETGLTKKIPESPISLYWADLTWRPLQVYAYALLNVGRLDEAENTIKEALKMNRQDEKLLITHDLIFDAKERRDTGKCFRKIANYLEKKGEQDKCKILLGAIPKELDTNIFITSIKNQYLPIKKWEKNEIAYFCPKTVEEWCPDNIKKGGIGGSETAVIELAKKWQKAGWKVTIYNWCSSLAGNYDGVEYKNFWEINWQDEFNVLIVWRYPELFDADIKAKLKILDLHDVGWANEFTEKRLKNIDKVLVKTKAHRELYSEIPDEKIEIINNGIDPERFKGKEKKEPFRLLYCSTLDRGLELLLTLFPQIKKEVPEAELHLYYGFKTYYELEKDNPVRMMELKRVEKLIKETEGVINHGRLDQWTLAKDMMKSAIWSYPTGFYEISCISAMETQMAQCLPITSNYAALKETIKFGIKIDGENHTPEYQKEWLEKVIHYLKHPEEREKIMKDAPSWIKDNFDWKVIGQKWEALFKKYV